MTPRNGAEGAGRDWLLVGAAWLALVLTLSVWLMMDRRPPAWESARQLERAVRCADGAGRSAVVLDRSALESPIIPCAAAAIYRLYPSDVAAAQVVIFVALGVGMAATYLLARDLGGAAAAVPAAWLFGAAPIVIERALRFELDLPLAAMVAVALLVLSRSDRLTRTGVSAVAGVALGVGMLVKPTFALYVAGPIFWLVALERSLRAACNLALAVVLAAAICLPWYGPRLIPAPVESAPAALRLTAAGVGTALVQQLGALVVLLVIVGVVMALLRGRGFAIVAFVVPLTIVAVDRHEGGALTLPLLPAAAVLGGMAVAALPGPARVAGLVAVGLIGAVQVSTVAWGVPPAFALPVLDAPWVVESKPSGGNWRHRDVLRAIAADSGGGPLTVSVLPDHAFFSASNFGYYARRDRVPFRIVPAWSTDPIGIDYVIGKSGDAGPPRLAQAGQRASGQLARDPTLARVYPAIAEFPLPDGSTASVRVRRVPEGVSMAPEAVATALDAAIRRQLGAVAREADNLALRIEHDAEIVRGRIKRIELSADSAVLSDYRRPDAPRLRVRRLTLVADDVLVNPFSLEAGGRAELLDAGRLRVVRAEVSGDDAQEFLGQLKPFRRTRVRLTTDAVYVTARQPGVDVLALVRVVPGSDGGVALHVQRASIGWIPLPTGLVSWVMRRYDPTERLTRRLPFPVEIARVAVTEQSLRIGD
jgi:dolichyl-phosphate-mannose-protein mannosyltransferase